METCLRGSKESRGFSLDLQGFHAKNCFLSCWMFVHLVIIWMRGLIVFSELFLKPWSIVEALGRHLKLQGSFTRISELHAGSIRGRTKFCESCRQFQAAHRPHINSEITTVSWTVSMNSNLLQNSVRAADYSWRLDKTVCGLYADSTSGRTRE